MAKCDEGYPCGVCGGDVGSIVAFRRVEAQRPGVSLNLLWALEGAVLDVDWRDLPRGARDDLRRAVGRDVSSP